MPAGPRLRRQPTDEWDQLRLLVASPAQEAYELLRPIVLVGQSARSRAREAGVPERSLRRTVARFEARGRRSLFEGEPGPPPPALLERTETTRRLPPPGAAWPAGPSGAFPRKPSPARAHALPGR